MEYLKKKVNRKYHSDIKQKDFYKHYKNNATHKPLPYSKWCLFISDIFKTLSEEMILSNKEVHLKNIGKFRIKSKKLPIFNKEGVIRRRVDWEACWKYWESLYPNLTRDEIIKIKHKPIIRYENEHTNGETYTCFWDSAFTYLKFSSFYHFVASRQYKRLVATVAKDPNRKIFYYG